MLHATSWGSNKVMRQVKKLITTAIAACFVAAIYGCSTAPRSDVVEADEVVVLVHGFGRSGLALWRFAKQLEGLGYSVHRIDYDSFRKSPAEIVASVEQQIRACCTAEPSKVHFVGHSLGGLLVRAYLEKHRLANLGQVVLIGTPNQGTEFVDRYRDRWWMQIAGTTALSLGTDTESFPNSLSPPDYPLGVIAGFRSSSSEWGVSSALDDGLVPVASTLIEGMNDFLLVESGHSAMRYNSLILAQTDHYLRHGQFHHHRREDNSSATSR